MEVYDNDCFVFPSYFFFSLFITLPACCLVLGWWCIVHKRAFFFSFFKVAVITTMAGASSDTNIVHLWLVKPKHFTDVKLLWGRVREDKPL